MKPELSATMQAALSLAESSDGVLIRYPGGFWAKRGWQQWNGDAWFGTPTIEALVSRGRMAYTDWKERKNGSRFPIEATILET